MSHFNIGRDKLDRVFKELQSSGYLVEIIKLRGSGGKFEGVSYIVYDLPINRTTENPHAVNHTTGKPHAVKPCYGKPTSTKYYSNKELIELITNSPKTNFTKGSAEWEKLSNEEKELIDPLWFI